MSQWYSIENKRRTVLIAVLLSVLGFVSGVVYLPFVIQRAINGSTEGPEHVFTVIEPSGSLSEKLALEMATKTMALDGFGGAEWEIVCIPADTSMRRAPNKCFSRNSLDPNLGYVLFRRRGSSGNPEKLVTVEMVNGEVKCHVRDLK